MKIYINTFIQFLIKKYGMNLEIEMEEFKQLHRYEFLNQKEKVEYVLNHIAEVSNVDPLLIKSRSRIREIVEWRHIARYICHKNEYGTLRFIGQELGGHDHSTVIHSVNVVEDMIKIQDKTYLEKINSVKHLLDEKNTQHIH